MIFFEIVKSQESSALRSTLNLEQDKINKITHTYIVEKPKHTRHKEDI